MDKEAQDLLNDIEKIEERLEELLPGNDRKHRDEVLDICSLLKQRAEMYFREYGVLS